ncbi:putative inorganic phosphate cotransporter isoform X1 [Zeugodacus cucurbitae]|uniref:putative inorganic phosphate cotransporter isoform X1 n=1 Tax=Zeugodacus cucurbitae TaxID=28588 RepID=UPI000596A603|nr:putative inorganic phosphate cotransporter isoform X1 [Zeugodacus cucurbitae]XP_028894299.1 putative inorganic phosphate cotransporter isoform X1 [Zeugodacus cucurbitae]XP_054088908.1 putative inorganic phosphate cotransporter isoform X1 [Zeugodacus cucurbitae]XP_054088909.1 putative inorganic phosphate cotransporter isoform X1 [Zeugodacus cucurbitae]XP_054088910.1 putative inorganic phosphate cotransporter isoform X1 [Zeugodacus cucurbitae]
MTVKKIWPTSGNVNVDSAAAPKDDNEVVAKGACCMGFGIRHFQAFLIFLGLSVAYSLRVNLSVAIVAMTDKDAANPDFDEFSWNEKTKSLLLSSFFWGYICTQVPGGALARKFGGKTTLLCGVLICSILAILTPIFAKIGDWQLVCALRVAQGLCQGMIFPSTHTLLSHWSPLEDRANFATYCYSGSQFGTVVMMATSGVIASSALGWPSIFYLSGGIGVVWAIVWFIWGASTPAQSKLISPEEKKFIEQSIGVEAGDEHHAPTRTPWVKMFTTPAFLVLILTHCTNNWGFWTLLTEIPTYMKNVFGMDIKSNALLSALPYFAMFLMCFVFSGISSIMNRKQCIPLSVSRKLFNSIGHWIPVASLIALGYVSAEGATIAIVLLTVTVGVNAAPYLGFQVNHIDLSPNFAGILMGITNCAANIMSIIAPLIVGFIVTDEHDPNQWRIIFFIAAGFYFVGNLLFIIFGSTDVQSWNDPQPKPSPEKRNSTQLESQH